MSNARDPKRVFQKRYSSCFVKLNTKSEMCTVKKHTCFDTNLPTNDTQRYCIAKKNISKTLEGGKKGRILRRAIHFYPRVINKDNDNNNNNNTSNVFKLIIILHVFRWSCEDKTSHGICKTYRH
jgi:hypothetical protein